MYNKHKQEPNDPSTKVISGRMPLSRSQCETLNILPVITESKEQGTELRNALPLPESVRDDEEVLMEIVRSVLACEAQCGTSFLLQDSTREGTIRTHISPASLGGTRLPTEGLALSYLSATCHTWMLYMLDKARNLGTASGGRSAEMANTCLPDQQHPVIKQPEFNDWWVLITAQMCWVVEVYPP